MSLWYEPESVTSWSRPAPTWEQIEQDYLKATLPTDRTFDWWDQYPLDPHVPTSEEMQDFKLFRMTEHELRELASTFRFGTLTTEERPLSCGVGLPASAPDDASRHWRCRCPTRAEHEALAALVQGTADWLRSRKGGIGGSEIGAVMNAGHYLSQRDVWMRHAGRVGQDARPPEDCFFFDHGHAGEPYARDYYSLVMGVRVALECGIVAHPKVCRCQSSPDGCVILRPGVYHNYWSMADPRRGNLEIKCPVYQVHGSRLVPCYPFLVPLDYGCQQQAQSSTCDTTWNDFCSCWRAGLMRNVVPLPTVPYLQDPKNEPEGRGNIHEDGSLGPGDLKYEMVEALGLWSLTHCVDRSSAVVPCDLRVFRECKHLLPDASIDPRLPRRVWPDPKDPLDMSKAQIRYYPHEPIGYVETMVRKSNLAACLKGDEERAFLIKNNAFGRTVVREPAPERPVADSPQDARIRTELMSVLRVDVLCELILEYHRPDMVRFTVDRNSTVVDLIQSYLGPLWYAPRAYLAGRMHVTRHYRNDGFCLDMLDAMDAHCDSVRDKIEPLPSEHNSEAYPPGAPAMETPPVAHETPKAHTNETREIGRGTKRKLEQDHDINKRFRPHGVERTEEDDWKDAGPEPYQGDYYECALPETFHKHKLILLPMKRVEWVIHPQPVCPPYEDMFRLMDAHEHHPDNLRYKKRGVLKDSYQQTCTVRGSEANWIDPVLPEHWPWPLDPKTGFPQFYITVFVTSYPNARPLGNNDGLPIDAVHEGVI